MKQDDLIKKWLNDELTEAERAQWETVEDRSFMERLVADAQAFRAADQSQPESFSRLKDRLPEKPTPEKQERYWMRIAAVLVIGLALWFGLSDFSGVVLDAPKGEQLSHVLPDRSEVRLNAGSRITYSEKDWESDRSLQLQGEAFFDVEKGATFQVETTIGSVQVLGTEFNVRQRKGLFQVRCFEGKVAVRTGGQTIELTPGQGVRLLGEEVLKITHNNTKPQWLEDQSHFEALPYFMVMEELMRQFDVTIQYPTDLQHELFTGGFDHSSLERALRAVASPMELEVGPTTDATITLKKRAP